ncbi:hypothetical protein [Pseudomonas agarici]|uniref:hypothetical protein n=1 Tax=Pseudomonas agarici TaxID=46677 RepID=UPI0021098B0B|nr:hypothetical protein [Pseudomonas agarici]
MHTEETKIWMKAVYHADLRDALANEDYWLQAGGRRYPLIAHTDETRAVAKASNARLAATPDECLTHYTRDAVDLPADCVIRVHIKHTLRTRPQAKSQVGLGNVAVHVPPPQALNGAHATAETAFHATINYPSTAKALIFHHPDLINADPALTATIYNYMDNDQAISDQFQTLALEMRQMGPPGEESGWATLVPFTPPKSAGKGCDGHATYYISQPTEQIVISAGAVATALMKATKNDMTLKNKKWTLQPGTSVQDCATEEQTMRLAVRIDLDQADDWQATLGSTGTAYGLQTSIQVLDSARRQLRLTMSNTYVRYLGAYIRFFDAKGNAISVADWKIDNPDMTYNALRGLNIDYDDLRWLGYIGPVNNVMAVPILSDPGVLQVTLTFPEDAVSAAIYGSGLGTGSDAWPKSPIVGGVMTGCVNLAVPAFMLGFATAMQACKPLYHFVNGLMSDAKFLSAVIGGGLAYYGTQFGTSAANKQMNWHAFSSLAKVLFDPAATKLLAWIEAEMVGEELVDEIPFAGWIIAAINVVTGIAQIAETIVEVATSPWNIANSISTSITTTVKVHPDPRHQAFPQPPAGSKASLKVKVIYQNQLRATVIATVPVPTSTPPILAAVFPNNTLGGQVKFEADYYIDTWLAGKATTGVVNNDEADASDIEMFLVQYPVPLSEKSVYEHSALLTYQNATYVWQSTGKAPTATITDANTSSDGNAISIWSGLTLSQRYGAVGTAWKAAGMGITSLSSGLGGQLFAMQNTNIPGTPMDDLQFPAYGLDAQTLLVYDPYPPKFLMQDGNWIFGPDGHPLPDPNDQPLGEYYVDPRKANNDPLKDGGFHLRKVTLSSPTPFDMGNNLLSYGRFQLQPDSIALHPSGFVIAVSTQPAKIQIGQLVPAGAADADVPMARIHAGLARTVDRPGLLFHPVAVSCAYDGTVLVLEDTKSFDDQGVVLARVQAFDLNGNPVSRFFDGGGLPTSFLNLSTTGDNTYLDICAIGDQHMTYLYILYYAGDGSQVSDYHMAIYQYGTSAPTTNPLVTTDGLAAARLAVDMWHTLYALNYAMVTDGQGKPAGPKNATTGPNGRTVPSISEWLPPVPQ